MVYSFISIKCPSQLDTSKATVMKNFVAMLITCELLKRCSFNFQHVKYSGCFPTMESMLNVLLDCSYLEEEWGGFASWMLLSIGIHWMI